MKIAVIAYAAALALLLLYALRGPADGAVLMALINILLAGVAAAVVAALGTEAWAWLPWRSMAMSLACLIIIALLAVAWTSITTGAGAAALLAAGIAAALVMAATWCGSADLRRALAR
jgi:hypothetical protein